MNEGVPGGINSSRSFREGVKPGCCDENDDLKWEIKSGLFMGGGWLITLIIEEDCIMHYVIWDEDFLSRLISDSNEDILLVIEQVMRITIHKMTVVL